MNTPLSKEEREDIAATITNTASQWGGGHKQLVRAMEAERYWREAVKNADDGYDDMPHGNGSYYCVFCKNDEGAYMMSDTPENIVHADGCPKFIAQEAPHA